MLTHAAAVGTSPSHVPTTTTTTTTTRPPSTPPPSSLPAIGYFATTRAIRAAARLTSTERLVLLTITGHASNRTGEAWPSIPTLAAECGLTTRTIERTIAALVAADWLQRDTAAGPWGTNRYRVTPRPDDVRPPRRRRERPQGRPFAGRVTPDAGSGPPPSRVQVTPDAGSADLLFWDLPPQTAVSAAPSLPDAHTDLEVDQEQHEPETAAAAAGDVEAAAQDSVQKAQEGPSPAFSDVGAGLGASREPKAQEGPSPAHDVAKRSAQPLRATESPIDVAKRSANHDAAPDVEIIAALAEHPELRPLARPPVAALLAAERRPLPVVRRALAELVEHARLAAAAGDPWSTSTLARKARAYVRRAYAEPATTTRPPSTPETPEPPPAPPALASTVGHLRGVLSALGGRTENVAKRSA